MPAHPPNQCWPATQPERRGTFCRRLHRRRPCPVRFRAGRWQRRTQQPKLHGRLVQRATVVRPTVALWAGHESELSALSSTAPPDRNHTQLDTEEGGREVIGPYVRAVVA